MTDISVKALFQQRGVSVGGGLAQSLPWLSRPLSLRWLVDHPDAFPLIHRKLVFVPQVNGFAFDNSWFFDDVEKSKIQEVSAAALATVYTLLAPVVIPAVAPVQGFVDALGALFGIPPGVGEVVEGKLAVDKIKNIIDTRLMSSYGLCGGMASSALDYLLAGRPVPRRYTSPPTRPEGNVLRDYIWTRLLDGMEAGVASSTVEWIVILKLGLWGGSEELLRRTRGQWSTLRAHIDANSPWPIVLIGTTNDPFSDHQVLAYGYDDWADGTSTLYVYDPNHHDQEAVWRLNFGGKTLVADEGISANGSRGPLQGFFSAPYTPNLEPPL
jgi:hypothetical protein